MFQSLSSPSLFSSPSHSPVRGSNSPFADLGSGVLWRCCCLTEDWRLPPGFAGRIATESVAALATSPEQEASLAGVVEDTLRRLPEEARAAGGFTSQDGLVSVIVPEAQPGLAYCRWDGDGHYDMSRYDGVPSPPTLGQVIEVVRMVEAASARSRMVLFLSSERNCAAGAVLAGAFLALTRGMSHEDAWAEVQGGYTLEKSSPANKSWDRFPLPFSRSPMTYPSSLTVQDCIAGLVMARERGFVADYNTFDLAGWQFLRRKFDASWLIPGEVLALAHPSGTAQNPNFPGLLENRITDPGVAIASQRTLSGTSRHSSPARDGKSGLRDLRSFPLANIQPKSHSPERGQQKPTWMDRSTPSSERSPRSAESDRSISARISDTASQQAVDEWDLDSENGGNHCPDETVDVDFEMTGLESGIDCNMPCEVPNEPSPACFPSHSITSIGRRSKSGCSRSGTESAATDCPTATSQGTDASDVRSPGSSPFSVQTQSDDSTEEDIAHRSNFLTYFLSTGVCTVIRLNSLAERPDQGDLIDMLDTAGLRTLELQFEDGRIPPKDVIKHFLTVCKSSLQQRKLVAVHCMAGLGRTGVLLGAYAVAHHRINGRAWHGWARLCRPGSVQTQCQEVFIRGLVPNAIKKNSSFERMADYVKGIISPKLVNNDANFGFD